VSLDSKSAAETELKNPDMAALLQTAIEAARGAGEILMSYYRHEYEIREKSYHNPVTTADNEADAFLREYLLNKQPDFGWLSEETADSEERLAKEWVWIVDPLDGTKEFIQGIPEFVVCIGLAHRGIPLLGVLYNPAKGELFQTTPEGVPLYNQQPARLHQADSLDQVAVLNSRSETRRGLWEPWRGDFRELVPMGSVAYKIALVATGQREFFVSLRPKNEWDLCAAHAVLRQTGGVLRTLEGQEVRYNQPNTIITPGVAGGAPELVEAFCQLYRERKGVA